MGCNFSSQNNTSPPGSPITKSRSDQEVDQEKNQELRAVLGFLAQVPLFQRLPKDQHPILATACVLKQYSKGDTIIRQGESGSEFFVIKSGEAQVLQAKDGGEPQEVASLKSGDYFGEGALLKQEPRTATIRARDDLSALKITRQKFEELKLTDKLQFANHRKAVGAGNGAASHDKAKAPTKKTSKERSLMEEALKKNENLQTIVSLDAERISQMIDVAWKETVHRGRELITQGDLEADYFYIVQEGSFEILLQSGFDQAGQDGRKKPQSAEQVVDSKPKKVGEVRKGGSFGELALLYLVPRAATVQAKEDSVVWVIDRNNFKNILMKVSDQKVSEYVAYLDRVELLKTLAHPEKKAISKAMIEVHFIKDDVVLRQGEPGNTFYVLYDGEVKIVKDGSEVSRLKATTSSAQYFGERALLNNEDRAATVQVVSDNAKAMALDRESFNLLLGPLEDIFKRPAPKNVLGSCLPCMSCFQAQGNSSRLKARSLIASELKAGTGGATGRSGKAEEKNKAPKTTIFRKDLKRIGLLGCGGFGTVELWEHKETNVTYAMKGLSKGYIVKTGMQDSVMTERFILMMTNSKFIIALHETFNGAQNLYFLLEPALGGELHATYNRRGFHGSERHAKYYTGGVVYAFEHLHERRIIYRDLKPENLMLNEKGHLKLTDMGLSKFVIGKTYTTCGTPDYFAPELLASTGHTNAVDWWTLGVLVFEMMTGHPPFESESHMQIFSKVMKGISKVKFPQNLQGPCEHFIKAIMTKEPCDRLPMKVGGTKNLKNHEWFHGFDWESLWALTLEPPYSPVVRSKTDLQNFSVSKEDMPTQLPYVDDGTGWDKDFASSN